MQRGLTGSFAILFALVLQAAAVPLPADDIAKASTEQETPPTVCSAYGVSGAVLWLAADSGVTTDKDGGVTALADKTGNFVLTANNADQEPTFVATGLNGKPVLRFNGDQSLYSSDNFGGVLNRDMTMIVVAMSTGSSSARPFRSTSARTRRPTPIAHSPTSRAARPSTDNS